MKKEGDDLAGCLIILIERVCRKSPFESIAISRQRRFLNQHPGVPFRLQLPLYFQTQPTITFVIWGTTNLASTGRNWNTKHEVCLWR
jgi:hypothetical protein